MLLFYVSSYDILLNEYSKEKEGKYSNNNKKFVLITYKGNERWFLSPISYRYPWWWKNQFSSSFLLVCLLADCHKKKQRRQKYSKGIMSKRSCTTNWFIISYHMINHKFINWTFHYQNMYILEQFSSMKLCDQVPDESH